MLLGLPAPPLRPCTLAMPFCTTLSGDSTSFPGARASSRPATTCTRTPQLLAALQPPPAALPAGSRHSAAGTLAGHASTFI